MKTQKNFSTKRIFETPLPDRLYHYTSSAGLMGILKTSKIWATKIHFLNDKSELNLAFKYIRAEVKRQLKKGRASRSPEELEKMLAILDNIEKINVSVASFTEEGDQLSQWRGYCKVGDGYSLGFDGEKLRQKLNEQLSYRLAPCAYKECEHNALVEEIVKSCRVEGEKYYPETSRWSLSQMYFAKAVLLVAPMIKAKGFIEEKEWRLITAPLSFDTAQFRQGKFSLIPYWEIDIDLQNTLREIIISPTPEQELSEEAVRGLITKYFPSYNNPLRKIKIIHSQVPFRDF